MKRFLPRCAGVCLFVGALLCLSACEKKGDSSVADGPTFGDMTGVVTSATAAPATTTAPPAQDGETTTTTKNPGSSVSAMQEFVQTERVNGIAIGMTEAEVIAACGEPSEKCEPQETVAGVTQEYRFGSRSNYVTFLQGEDGTRTVASYGFSVFETASGIKNGAARDDVVAAYKSHGLQPDMSFQTGATMKNAETLYIGEWRVSCMRFRFSEDTLTKIYVTGGAVG